MRIFDKRENDLESLQELYSRFRWGGIFLVIVVTIIMFVNNFANKDNSDIYVMIFAFLSGWWICDYRQHKNIGELAAGILCLFVGIFCLYIYIFKENILVWNNG